MKKNKLCLFRVFQLWPEKTGPFRVPEILSNDEIQVFRNLRTRVSEELILFNVFFQKSFSDECTDFLMF